MDSPTSPPARSARLLTPTSIIVFGYTVFPLIGAGLGWVLRLLSEWARSVPDLPLHDWITVLAAVDNPWGTILAMVAGAAFVAVCVRLVLRNNIAISVTRQRLIWKVDARAHRINRDEITAIYIDNIGPDEYLVVLGTDGQELVRGTSNLDLDVAEKTFVEYGYPWFDADPHTDEFRRWVPDMPELSPTVNALMSARATALEKDDEADAEELRTDLGKLGVVLRQTDDRQFFRLLAGAAGARDGATVD